MVTIKPSIAINSSLLEEEDVVRQVFKYYKSNKPKPSLKDVIHIDSNTEQVIRIQPGHYKEDERINLLGLKNHNNWKLYSLKDHPGLLYIQNPFTYLGQRYWIRRCLENYPKYPNKKNLDIEMTVKDWWKECYITGQCNRTLQKKMRWTTLGYHHNWDTKVYTEKNKTQFPADLAELCEVIAQCLGFTKFNAEAAIVNYYHMDSTLSPHTDHSEVNLEAPLFSFSFGQSAIFLIGGRNKSDKPSALLLRSGDIVIMSKEARLCYHSVPRILSSATSPWNDEEEVAIPNEIPILKYVNNPEEVISFMKECADNKKWSEFNNYTNKSRINVNVRQVLNEGQKSLIEKEYIHDVS